jgi:hypothetical protein
MTILGVVFVLIVVGVLLYLVHAVIPLDPKIRLILDVVVILAVLVWLAQGFGLLTGLDRPIRFR